MPSETIPAASREACNHYAGPQKSQKDQTKRRGCRRQRNQTFIPEEDLSRADADPSAKALLNALLDVCWSNTKPCKEAKPSRFSIEIAERSADGFSR